MKKSLFAALVLAATAFGLQNPTSVVPTVNSENEMNRTMGGTAYKYSLGTQLRQAHNTAVGVYDFTKVGGAASVPLELGITLPTKAIVRFVFYDVISAPSTLGSSQVGFYVSLSTTPDLKGYTALASWTGRVAGTPNDTTTNMIKITSQKKVYAVVSGSALAGGKIKVFVDYVISE